MPAMFRSHGESVRSSRPAGVERHHVMKASASIERGHVRPASVWPRGGSQLIVVISDVDARGELIVAHGLDPDRPSGEGNVVFAAELARRDLGQFIRTVVAAAIADRDAEASVA